LRIPRVLRNRLWWSPERLLRLIPAGLLTVCLLVSLTLYFTGSPWARRVFFFPKTGGERVFGEPRRLPVRRGLEANIDLYLEEAVLGPTKPLLRRVVARDTRLISVVAQQRTVYVNLSKEVIRGEPGSGLTLEHSLQVLADGVYFNFPQVRRLYFLVEGQLPGPPYDEGFSYKKIF
jgi:hypothetical protein